MYARLLRLCKQKFSFLIKYDAIKTLYWRRRLHLQKNSHFYIYPNSIVAIAKDASIDITDGEISLNVSWFEGRERKYKSELRIESQGELIVKGNFQLVQGASIFIGEKAILKVNGWSYINTNSVINCFQHIEIGTSCVISDNVSITDSDSHCIIGKETDMSAPIIIGNHVWIGKNVTILKGVTIGDGAIIGAGSIVCKSIPSRCLAVGNPARVIKENVDWK